MLLRSPLPFRRPLRLALTLTCLPMWLTAAAETPAVELFELDQVRLLEGPFSAAQALNRDYLLALEPDRLLAPFRREAGLEPKAESYPNWESSGLDGHTAGHYLTALAQEVATGGAPEFKERLDYMLAELTECQQAHGDGYIGGVPQSRRIWSEVGAGEIDAGNFSLNGGWVPWYNLHKLFAGLRDAWLHTGSETARDSLVALSDWCLRLIEPLSDEQMQAMLQSEHGGMNEVLADVAAMTGEERYLAAARRFSHRAILDPLLAREDALTGLHANTQIPKVIGFARVAELGGEDAWSEAAAYFWDRVVHQRSVAIGGNSVREHFHPADDFRSMIESREGPETCNTHNMLRLTEQLFRTRATAEWADYYERALYNHILSSQHPEHGGFVYFTPMRPRHYRVYSQPDQCFWCCVGSGMENHGKYGRFIYAHAGDDLLVNLFIASRLEWAEKDLVLRQETKFPEQPGTRLRLEMAEPQRFGLRVRQPAWAGAEGMRIRVNGKGVDSTAAGDGYHRLEREWRDGDTVEITFTFRPSLERLPDGSDYVAVRYGPLVLAAVTPEGGTPGLIADDGRMAHIAPGAYLPLVGAPMLVGTADEVTEALEPVPGQTLRFRLGKVVRPDSYQDLQLRPFHEIHDERYMLYWRQVAPEDYETVQAEIAAAEAASMALEARTLDRVHPGEQQSEVEHAFAAEGGETGARLGRRWRAAQEWFGYRLDAGEREPSVLRVTYYGGDRDRRFAIRVNGEEIARETLQGGAPDSFIERNYRLDALAGDGVYEVRFEGLEESAAGPIYDLRLLAPPPADTPPTPPQP